MQMWSLGGSNKMIMVRSSLKCFAYSPAPEFFLTTDKVVGKEMSELSFTLKDMLNEAKINV